MIPALLHGRLLVAGAGDGIVNPPDWASPNGPDEYYAISVSSVAPAVAYIVFAVLSDGNWVAQDQAGLVVTGGSGSWKLPTGPGVGAGYSVRFTPTSAGGVADITNGAADWQSLSGNHTIRVSKTRSVAGSSFARYNVLVEIRKDSTGQILTSGVFQANVTAEVTATGGDGGGCVEASMWLEPGLLAGDVQLGQAIDVAAYNPDAIVRREVQRNSISPQPCWRIVSESGAAVVASDSTPMTLRDGTNVKFPEMLGREVLVADERGLTWEKVVECAPVGERDVVFINVGGNCYFAGESPVARIATHNLNDQPK